MERDKTFESPVPTLIVIDMWLQNEQLAEHREDFS